MLGAHIGLFVDLFGQMEENRSLASRRQLRALAVEKQLPITTADGSTPALAAIAAFISLWTASLKLAGGGEWFMRGEARQGAARGGWGVEVGARARGSDEFVLCYFLL